MTTSTNPRNTRRRGKCTTRQVTFAVAVLAATFAAGCSAAHPGRPVAAAVPTLSARSLEQISHDGFDAHAEPYVAANPRHPADLLAASRVYQGTNEEGLATYTSLDGGRSWRDNGVLPGPAPAGNATVTFDAAGHGYVAGIAGPAGPSPSFVAYVWRTDDNGAHFDAGVAAIPVGADHPQVAADPAVGSPDVYLAAIHCVGSQATCQLWFTRSTDAGGSFAPPRPIDPTRSVYDKLAVVAAGPRGTVSVGYYSELPHEPVTFNVVTSTDHGVTFNAPVELGVIGQPPQVPGLSPRTGPAITIDPTSDDIFATAATTDPTTGWSDVDLFASRDEGRTWEAPIVFSAPPGTVYMEPQLAAAPGGRVGLSAFAVTDGRVRLAMSISAPGGTAFPPLRSITSAPGFDFHLGLATGQGAATEDWIGSYQGLAATSAAFHPVWNDTSTGRLELFSATVLIGQPS
jgi:hypothetical protein